MRRSRTTSDHRSRICTALTSLGVEPPIIDVWEFGKEVGRSVESMPSGGREELDHLSALIEERVEAVGCWQAPFLPPEHVGPPGGDKLPLHRRHGRTQLGRKHASDGRLILAS